MRNVNATPLDLHPDTARAQERLRSSRFAPLAYKWMLMMLIFTSTPIQLPSASSMNRKETLIRGDDFPENARGVEPH